MNSKRVLINIFRWLILLFVQIFFLRNFVLYGLAAPFTYCLFILILPFRIPNFLLFVLAFLTGLTIDAFYDTLGLHTSACVVLAFVRISFIFLTLNRDTRDESEPSMGNMGFKWFSLYALVCVFSHHLILYFLETFKFSSIGYTLGKCIFNVCLTLFSMLLIEFAFHNKKLN